VLVAKGADVNAKDNKAQTPLAQAVAADEKEMVALLKKSGAN
jgi:ankyrin repeat protein